MVMKGIKFGGTILICIRYADDTVLFADSENTLSSLDKALVQASGKRMFKLITSTTKVMVISRVEEDMRTRIKVIGKEQEQISWYKFLGSMVTRDERCVEEIKTCIAIAKTSFNRIKTLVTNRSGSVGLRKRF